MDTGSESEMKDSTENLLRELKEVVRDGEELMRAGAGELSDQAKAARTRLSAALESARGNGPQTARADCGRREGD